MSDTESLEKINDALREYHTALSNRQNGNLAAGRFVETVEEVLRLPERQGDAKTQYIIEQMKVLSDSERLEIINSFCKHCGSLTLPCHCWNDE